METLQIYFDGSYRDTDETGGIGVVIAKNNRKLYTISRGIQGKASHDSELKALITAIQEAVKLRAKYPLARISVMGDNQGVIGKFTKYLKKNSEAPNRKLPLESMGETFRMYYSAVTAFVNLGGNAEVTWINRERNKADGCSKKGRRNFQHSEFRHPYN